MQTLLLRLQLARPEPPRTFFLSRTHLSLRTFLRIIRWLSAISLEFEAGIKGARSSSNGGLFRTNPVFFFFFISSPHDSSDG